jgi:hypothetical protein
LGIAPGRYVGIEENCGVGGGMVVRGRLLGGCDS